MIDRELAREVSCGEPAHEGAQIDADCRRARVLFDRALLRARVDGDHDVAAVRGGNGLMPEADPEGRPSGEAGRA